MYLITSRNTLIINSQVLRTNSMNNNNSLVLGGGGVTGIAWMTGLLHALSESGLQLSNFNSVYGTSAGSTVGAQITSGLSLEQLYQRQVDSKLQNHELTPKLNKLSLLFKLIPALLAWKSPTKFRQRIASIAMKTSNELADKRLAVINDRLPNTQWPDASIVDLNIVCIATSTGDIAVFNQTSNVKLIDAVAASCAVPLVWPCVKINGEKYIDGGIRSMNNADLAKDSDTILIISPTGLGKNSMPWQSLSAEKSLLEASGKNVVVIVPNESALQQMGHNPLDPNKRTDSAIAGFEQGHAEAVEVIQRLDKIKT